MRMNKRGSMFFGVAIGIVIFIFGVLFLPFLMDDVTTFRDAMSCEDTTTTGGNMLSCLMGDILIPYWILFFVSLTLGFVVGRSS